MEEMGWERKGNWEIKMEGKGRDERNGEKVKEKGRI